VLSIVGDSSPDTNKDRKRKTLRRSETLVRALFYKQVKFFFRDSSSSCTCLRRRNSARDARFLGFLSLLALLSQLVNELGLVDLVAG
jgi:hypothetical protein